MDDGSMSDWETSASESKCILCDRSSSVLSIEENGYVCMACEHCGLIFVSNKPSEQGLAALYQRSCGEYTEERGEPLVATNILHEWHNISVMRRHVKRGRLLEIGPGQGRFLVETRKNGYDVVGIEINKNAAKKIRERFGIHCEDTPLSAESSIGSPFNVVYHCDVLSHFYNPVRELSKIHDIISDNGIMIFETGNGAEMMPKYYAHMASFQLPIHLYFFGEQSLRELLRITGFEILDIKRYSLVAELMIWRLFMRFKRRGGNHKNGRESKGSSLPSSNAQGAFRVKGHHPRLRRALAELFHGSIYFARYHIGYMLPKKGRPQTLIVVARKLPANGFNPSIS